MILKVGAVFGAGGGRRDVGVLTEGAEGELLELGTGVGE